MTTARLAHWGSPSSLEATPGLDVSPAPTQIIGASEPMPRFKPSARAGRRPTAPGTYRTWSDSDAHPAAPTLVTVSQLKAITGRNSRPIITVRNRNWPTKAEAIGREQRGR